MRSLGRVLIPCDWCHKKTATWRQRQRIKCCSYKSGNAKDGRPQPETRKKQGRVVPYWFQKEHGPAETLISDIWLPELWDNKFLLFQATQCVVLCYGSPRKRVHAEIKAKRRAPGARGKEEDFLHLSWFTNVIYWNDPEWFHMMLWKKKLIRGLFLSTSLKM